MKLTRLQKAFDMRQMVKGHAYLLIIRDGSREQETYGILKIVSPVEAVFATIYGDIKISPEEVGREMDVKALRIEVDEEEELENAV